MNRLASSPMLLLNLAVVLVVGVVVLTMFIRWERAGHREIAVAILGGALLAQLAFYSVDSNIPVGLFRPGPLRLPELIIGAALAARLWTTQRLPRPTVTGVAWIAFFTWYASSALIGAYDGNSHNLVLFHAKLIVYAGGGYLLVAGVPIRRLISREVLGSWLLGLSVVVAAQIAFMLSDRAIILGDVGADAASVYLGLGLLVLLLEGSHQPARVPLVVAMAPLLLSPLVTDQRASFVHAAASVAVLGVVILGRTWKRRMSVQPTQLLLATVVVLTVFAIAVFPSLKSGTAVPPTVSSAVEKTFGGLGNEQSAEARVNQWESAKDLFIEQPLLGQGLGIEHTYFKPGIWNTGDFEEANVFDNALLDLLVRSGVVGAALFIIAMGLSIRDAWRVWMGHDERRVAAFGLAAMTILLGLAAKGIVESILEKVALACAIGIVAGAVASAIRDLDHPSGLPYASYDDVERPQESWS